MTEYSAGVCNIGREHQRKRFRAGIVALVLAAAYTGWVVATGRPAGYYAGTFLLSTAGFLGYLQARLGFCVAFGALARYEVDDGTGTVDEAELRREDRLRALELIAYSAGLAAAVTLLAYAVDGIVLG